MYYSLLLVLIRKEETTSKLLKSNADTHLIPYLETQNDLAETEIEIAQVLNSYFAN